MSDLGGLLEKVGERVTPRQDAFERLGRRRAQKQRNRRVATAAFALLIAVAGSVGAFVAFRGPGAHRPQPAAGETEEFLGLWPEQTLDAARAVQEAVGGGDPDVRWRLDPERTAAHFAEEVLGWPGEGLVYGEGVRGPDLLIVDVGTPPPSCPTPGCPPQMAERSVRLTEERLVRPGEGGIWSVTRVGGGLIDLPVEPGALLEPEQTIRAQVKLGGDLQAFGGATFRGVSCDARFSAEPIVESGPVEISVPGSSCEAEAGYLFVYTVKADSRWADPDPTDHEVTMAQDPFDSHMELVDLAAVPIRVAGPESPQAATEACDPAPFWPTYLPWLKTGELVPSPEVLTDGGNVSLVWFQGERSLQAPHVSLTTWASSPFQPPEESPSVVVWGSTGHLLWVGDAGVGEVAIVWTQEPGPCGSFSLHLVDPSLSRGEAEAEIRLIADSLDSVSTGPTAPYPRGPFSWCPDIEGTLPFGPDAEGEAAQVALLFSKAYLAGDEVVVAQLSDPSALGRGGWAIAGTPEGLRLFGSGATGGSFVEYGCGPEVASRTWAVGIDDGTESASADFTLYLVRRAGGWKVWGSY